MTYPINLTDGTLVVTVPAGVRDTTTFSITIIGKNVSNYGEDIAENFVHMLENFSNTSPPLNPLVGQLWYDSAVGAIKVFDGVNFIAIQTRVGSVLPASPSVGDMFFNENQRQLYVADSGGTFRFAGIPGGFVDNFSAVTTVEATRYGTHVENLYLLEAITLQPKAVLAIIYEWNGAPVDHPTLEPTDAENGRTVVAIWSDHDTFTADATSPMATNILAGFPGRVIQKGLNLRIQYPAIARHYGTNQTNLPTSDNTFDIGSLSSRLREVFAVTFNGTATSAEYADVAERFCSDSIYEKGTLVKVGGEKEITETTAKNDRDVLGVISTNPAFMMNSSAGNDGTHPYVALSGRVPTKIIGKIRKGDRVVASSTPGVGQAASKPNYLSIVGRCLEDKDTEEVGLVTVVVGVK